LETPEVKNKIYASHYNTPRIIASFLWLRLAIPGLVRCISGTPLSSPLYPSLPWF